MDNDRRQEESSLSSRPRGWLAGVLISLAGLGMALVGGVTYFALRSILQDTLEIYEMYAGMEGAAVSSMSPEQVRGFCVVALVIMVLGVAVAVAGIALTVSLRRGRKK